jgi:hypothetical protein
MSELTFVNVAMKNEISTCAGEVRFVPSNDVGPIHKLQQRFEIVEYENGKIIGCRQEWRDVPTLSIGRMSGVMTDRVEMLVAASERYMLAVKRLGEESGYNRLTYFEAPILKMPTPEMQADAHNRWLELNDAGQLLTAACSAARATLAASNGGR